MGAVLEFHTIFEVQPVCIENAESTEISTKSSNSKGPGVIAVTKQYMINVGIKPDGIIVVLLSRLSPGHVYPNTWLVHSKTEDTLMIPDPSMYQ